MARKHKSADSRRAADQDDREAEVRIIGGTFRGRRLNYHGDPVVRPMKHRTREAIFNLVSTECGGRHAVDLFAGTGALGLEALSRGATSATFIEKHVPSARMVEENIRILGVEDRAILAVTSAFLWGKRDLPNLGRTILSVDAQDRTDRIAPPWLAFCSPPYSFYRDRQEEMLDLIRRIQEHAPAESILIVETDDEFDFEVIRSSATPQAGDDWDVRRYAPAIVGLWRKGGP